MTPDEEQAIRARLLAMQAELHALQSGGASEMRKPVELDQTRQGRLSRMDALQLQEMAKATEARRALDLKRISAALARLDEGEYGYCITCGEAIAPRRLAANPATPTCLACAR